MKDLITNYIIILIENVLPLLIFLRIIIDSFRDFVFNSK